MSVLLNSVNGKQYLNTIKQLLPRNIQLSTTQKIVIVSISTSVVFIGVLARLLRRKKKIVDPSKLPRNIFNGKLSRISGMRSPYPDLGSVASSGRRSANYNAMTDRLNKQGSIVTSGKASVASGSIVSNGLPIPEGLNTSNLTPQQLGVMGMEALVTCIAYWEDALSAYRNNIDDGTTNLPVLGPEETAFCKDLQQLLEYAIELQENSEMLFLDEMSILFRSESGNKDTAPGKDVNLSEGESFASAQDMVADLREFEEFSEYFPDLEKYPLYQSALRQVENGGIPYRTLRTEIVKCGSDVEYLAKLHCLRLAFQHLLRDRMTYNWFTDAGRQILADLLLYADKDPKDFLIGYEQMIKYSQDPQNWRDLEEELSTRGIKALTFYDIVLDYILMDAFEDLNNPPSSVTAVIQNRWLSKGFKETALTTAVWSVLKAKRRRLRFPDGFMSHFYTISEQLSPLLAWGFLGSDEMLRETCVYFKDQVIEFLIDIFNFHKSKYTTVEDLSKDVFTHLGTRVENICQRLSVQS
ncbi:mitoguardin [Diorhabda carinulata]|uniref:mitoguardin n=1 Tax=Diorhabda carinulata TaxID=1163345 RepID=UPI0025A0E030|nr:mitoguardin [Diorhabda carinulata]